MCRFSSNENFQFHYGIGFDRFMVPKQWAGGAPAPLGGANCVVGQDETKFERLRLSKRSSIRAFALLRFHPLRPSTLELGRLAEPLLCSHPFYVHIINFPFSES